MKKITSLLLAALLCLGCFSALAEDIDLTGVEANAPAVKIAEKPALDLHDVAMAAAYTDVVEVTDAYVSVTANNVTIRFDKQKAGGGFMCLTKDLMASLTDYLRYDDPYAVQDILLSNDINLLVMDEFTKGCYYVYFLEADSLSALVGDFTSLSTRNQTTVAQKLASTSTIVTYNNIAWISTGSIFATIVNGQYICVEIDSDVTAEDVPYFLGALSVTAAR